MVGHIRAYLQYICLPALRAERRGRSRPRKPDQTFHHGEWREARISSQQRSTLLLYAVWLYWHKNGKDYSLPLP